MFRHTASVCLFQQKAIWVYIRAGDHHKHAHCTCLDPYSADPEIGHHQLYILVCWIIHGRVLIDTSSISQQFAWLKHTVSFFEISFFPVYIWWAFFENSGPLETAKKFQVPFILVQFTVDFSCWETLPTTQNPRGFMELCWGHIKPRLGMMWFMALSCNFQGHCCAFFMQPMPGPQWYHYCKQTKEHMVHVFLSEVAKLNLFLNEEDKCACFSNTRYSSKRLTVYQWHK